MLDESIKPLLTKASKSGWNSEKPCTTLTQYSMAPIHFKEGYCGRQIASGSEQRSTPTISGRLDFFMIFLFSNP
jgi:hypothetical protein